MVIENLYIQTSLMVALSLFTGKEEGGALFINQRWTLDTIAGPTWPHIAASFQGQSSTTFASRCFKGTGWNR